MTKIGFQKILIKLGQIDEYVAYLEQLNKEIKSKDQFLQDFHFYGLAERYLQLSCQIIIDILDLIIIEDVVEKPESSSETISLLFNKKIISESLATRLQGITGFRNILVHEYGKIDRERVYKYLSQRLDDFKLFKQEVLLFIKNKQAA